jgi:nitroreductase
MNDRYESILSLRAIRQFQDRPVGPGDLDALLEAARWTGSSKNTQNWSFIVVDDPEQKEAICAAGDFMTPVRNAPMAICLVQHPNGYEFDTGRLAQNIMLAADALGLATCPVTLHREEVSSDVLGLPDGYRCRYAVAVGHPAASAGPKSFGGRKPIGELAHRNFFGSATQG